MNPLTACSRISQSIVFVIASGALLVAGCGSEETRSDTGNGSDTGSDVEVDAPDCSLVDCASPQCAVGFHAETPDGECCEICVPDEDAELCAGTNQSCNVLSDCVEGYDLIEYAPGCCACEPEGCEELTCTPPSCEEGEVITLPGDSCCPVCVPAPGLCEGSDVLCAEMVCLPGYIPSGGTECCSGCGPDPEFCADLRAGFFELRDELLGEPGVYTCELDSDCGVFSLSSDCAFDCGTVVSNAAGPGLVSQLAEYGTENCADCPQDDISCPAVEIIPVCEDGVCR